MDNQAILGFRTSKMQPTSPLLPLAPQNLPYNLRPGEFFSIFINSSEGSGLVALYEPIPNKGKYSGLGNL